jgi:DtxR family transcriptional regulator, Mn-dependent transcriptional regulator
MLQKLAEMKLVAYERYQGAVLTPAGEKIALEVVRHHRLIETYLMEAMGYSWDQVHDEADRLEHAISEEFEDRIARILGNPTHDPHGDPIPTKDGAVAATSHATLFDATPGRDLRIQRVRDEDPALLKQLAALGLVPQTRICVSRGPDAQGVIQITRADGTRSDVRREITDHVFVVEI